MNLYELACKIALDSSEYDNGLASAARSTGNFGETLKTGLVNIAEKGAAAIAAASAAIVAFGKKAVDVGAEFDAAMAQVAATSGTTVNEIVNLRDYAIEMGSKTAFSATQAAQALNYLALAGYDSETQIKTLPTVLNLAAAGGMELASASDMVTDALSALGYGSEFANTMVDQMAKTASSSNTSVAQLGEAMLTVGGTAKNLKGGVVELNTVLGLMANNGIKGSEAGTNLRNMLLKLQAPTDDAVKMLDNLGVSVFDEEGNLRSLKDVFTELSVAMNGMNDQAKTDIMSTLFNVRDIAAAEALIANVGDNWNALENAIVNSGGAAEQMASTQLDNLNGDVTLLKSAFEGLQIVVSGKLMPTIRKFVQFASQSISTITEAFENGGIEGVIDAIAPMLQNAISIITPYIPKFLELGMNLLASIAKGIIENLPLIVETFGQVVGTILQTVTENAPALIESFKEALESIANLIIENVPLFLDTAITLFMSLVDAIPTVILQLIDKIPEIIETILNMILDNLPTILEAAVTMFMGIVQAIPVILDRLLEKLPDIIMMIFDFIIEALPQIIDASLQMFMGLIDAIPLIIQTLIKNLPQIISAIVQGLLKSAPVILQSAVKLFGGIAKGLSQSVGTAIASIPSLVHSIVTGIADAVVKLGGKLKDIGLNLIKGLFEGIKSFNLTETISNVADGIVGGFKNFFGIHSPSTLFRDQIGFNIGAGLSEGLEDSERGMLRTIDDIGADLAERASEIDIASDMGLNGVSMDRNVRLETSSRDIETLIALLTKYLPQLANMRVVLDGKTTIGALLSEIDSALGLRYNSRLRGAT